LVASKELPPFVLARRFWGRGWLLILFALLNSMIAVSIAGTLVSTRMWYAMARLGSLPRSLSVVHPRHKTPSGAVTCQALVTFVSGLALGFWLGPDQFFQVMGIVVTLALALIYSAGNLGVFLLYRRRATEFRPLVHACFPLVSTAAVLWVAYNSIVPLPPPPLSYAPAIAAAWLLAGVTVLIAAKGLGRERGLLTAREAVKEATEEDSSIGRHSTRLASHPGTRDHDRTG
jgi:amino acid transporter